MLKLKEENMVYLLIKQNKKIKNKKLNYIKVRLFLIKVQKKTIEFKFKLPKNSKQYFIFYILLFRLANSKIVK